MEKYINILSNLANGTVFENTFLFSLAIIIATFIVAFLVKEIFRFLTQQIFSKSKVDVDDQIAEVIGNAVFKTVLISGFALFIIIFIDRQNLLATILKTTISLILAIWTFALITLSKIIFTFLSRLTRVHIIKRETVPLFHNMSAILIFILATYGIFAFVWDIDMTALIASLGVAGIAIGFAAKDTLANLFSGIFILSDQPYKLGDYIVLGTGERGAVTSIGIRSTRILTRDDVEITIPNSIMGNTSVINESGGPYKKTRITAFVGVEYGVDIEYVKNTLLDIARNTTDAQKEPAPRVRVANLGQSSIEFKLRVWVGEPADRGRTLDEIYTNIYNIFNEKGIKIPYQKHDLYIRKFPENYKLTED